MRGRLGVRRGEVKVAAGRKILGRTLGSPGRRQEPLHVGWMALALVLAAFLGAALGLVWQSAGFGSGEEEVVAPAKAD